MNKRTSTKALTLTAAAAGAVLLAGAPATAAPAAAAPAAPATWSVSHGPAVADGTRWTEPNTGGSFSQTVSLQGEFRSTGPDCYSLRAITITDLAPGPSRKVATQCGEGGQPVSFKVTFFMPTTTNYLVICKEGGTKTDCGRTVHVSR
ncbi:hypothetical protein [Streptomyces sp. NPDC089799]|uniref:hypothetical protein n=1 Tax=Streptomyces sp. NPDC089799 TaxID=3155066 RepID=UPI003438CECA